MNLHAIDAICSSIEGSTVTDCLQVSADWREFKLRQVAQAGAGRHSAQQREEQLRERLIAAAGAMDLIVTHPGWSAALERRITQSGPAKYGLQRVPDRRTINKTRDYLLAKCMTLPSCTPQATTPAHTASSST